MKSNTNQFFVVVIATIVALFLIKSLKKPEDYEPPEEKITKEDLKSVLKFIK